MPRHAALRACLSRQLARRYNRLDPIKMPLVPGARLGPYEIVAPLGAGGMGEVYRARDTRLDRTVAIKILAASLAADPEFRDRFEREARAISSLNHPHICTLFDVGHRMASISSCWSISKARRWPNVWPVAAALKGSPLDPNEALRIAIEICDALDKAHRSGIVHRDLKPANVFLVRSGGASAPPIAKLLDFGLAKSAAPAVATTALSMLPTTPPNLTAQGTILGTFQYMAPEQIEGLEADARTDIFAFGALLFEMLTGRTAFEGKTRASLLGAILKDEPPPVSRVQPRCPRGPRPHHQKVPREGSGRPVSERARSAARPQMGGIWIERWRRGADGDTTGPIEPCRVAGRRLATIALIATAVIALRRGGRGSARSRRCSSRSRRRRTRRLEVLRLEELALPHRWLSLLTAGTSCSSPAPNPRTRSGCDRSRIWQHGRFRNRRRDLPILVAGQPVHRVLRRLAN